MQEDVESQESNLPDGSLQQRLSHLIDERLSELNVFAEQHPKELRTAICHAVLQRDLVGIPGNTLPFSGRDGERMKEIVENQRKRYAYLADLLLRFGDGGIELPKTKFVSLKDWIEARVSFPEWDIRITFNSIRSIDIWREYFSAHEGHLSLAVALATDLVHKGVPVYRLDPDTGRSGHVSLTEPLVSYLYKRGEAFDVVNSPEVPSWAEELYFDASHLQLHSIIFGGLQNDEPAEVAVRRALLCKSIGIEDPERSPAPKVGSAWPWGDHETELLQLLARAAHEWWSSFDPLDATTAPTNDDVSAWLQQQGASGRMADAIATILRADRLPTGPRGSS